MFRWRPLGLLARLMQPSLPPETVFHARPSKVRPAGAAGLWLVPPACAWCGQQDLHPPRPASPNTEGTQDLHPPRPAAAAPAAAAPAAAAPAFGTMLSGTSEVGQASMLANHPFLWLPPMCPSQACFPATLAKHASLPSPATRALLWVAHGLHRRLAVPCFGWHMACTYGLPMACLGVHGLHRRLAWVAHGLLSLALGVHGLPGCSWLAVPCLVRCSCPRLVGGSGFMKHASLPLPGGWLRVHEACFPSS